MTLPIMMIIIIEPIITMMTRDDIITIKMEKNILAHEVILPLIIGIPILVMKYLHVTYLMMQTSTITLTMMTIMRDIITTIVGQADTIIMMMGTSIHVLEAILPLAIDIPTLAAEYLGPTMTTMM